ncbi:MAG: hypothetical protein WBG48_19415, partial [Pricia sp.]
KQISLNRYLKSGISKCIITAVENNSIGTLKQQLTAAITHAIKKIERASIANRSLDNDLEYADFNSIHLQQFHSNPEIASLEREQSLLRVALRQKQDELSQIDRRIGVTKSLTRNNAIKSLVSNIMKEFKKLSKEKQVRLVNDKGLLSRNVKNYIKEVVIFYVIEQKQWGVTFSKKQNALDTLSTASDTVILAMNLSSKYVHLATSAAHNASLVEFEICKRERDGLKEQLAKIDTRLQIMYAQQGTQLGFKGGFGDGGFSGGGASGGGSMTRNGW